MASMNWRNAAAFAIVVLATTPSIAQAPDIARDVGSMVNGVGNDFIRQQQNKGSARSSGGMELQSANPATSAVKQTKQQKAGAQSQQAARSPSGVPPANERRYVPDEVVVQVATSLTNQQTNALAQRFQLATLESVNLQFANLIMIRLRIPDRRSVPTVVRALETDNEVLFAQPNYLYALADETGAAAPSGQGDTARVTPAPSQPAQMTAPAREGDPTQYELEKMHLPQAHELARGNKVLVAMIDSGVDLTHPDLAGDIAGTFDAIGVGDQVHFHGTAVAGAIAAHGQLMGAAPAAQILAVRAFPGNAKAEAGSTTFAINKGLDWAAVHGARVINMSFAGPQDPAISRELALAHDKGVVLVAAAGNKGAKSPPLYPAADRNVISVTSTDRNDRLPEFANRGPYVSVAAPGVDLALLAPNNSLQRLPGTSFSSAYVTGIAALMLERDPSLTPDGLRQALVTTAHHLGAQGIDDHQSGGGLVDAYQAILAVAPAAASEAVVTPAANRQ